jgi:signal transduction histidine kinase
MRGLGRDLRSPLSTLVGLADVLVTGMPGPLNEEQESQLRVIRDSGRDVLALVDRLIEHAKGENRLVSLRAEETDLCETVRDVVHSMRPAAARRGLALTLSLDCPECRTVTNGRAVRQILENLISNAVKNTDRGAVGVLLSLQNGRACIEVMDTGRGIDKARIEEIFDHDGERVDDVLDSDPGTHISLGVCRDLAWHLGGDITVRSVPKAGSRFRLLLPRLSPAKV